MVKFPKFNNLENLSNSLGVQVILKKVIKNKFVNKIIE